MNYLKKKQLVTKLVVVRWSPLCVIKPLKKLTTFLRRSLSSAAATVGFSKLLNINFFSSCRNQEKK